MWDTTSLLMPVVQFIVFINHIIACGIVPAMTIEKANKTRKRGRGRPPLGDQSMEQITVRLPKPMLAAIDKMRIGRRDRPDRAVVIRRLIAEALQARGKREKH
jgi:hypothetical protein